jgi:TRAP-type uncharacterized transport system substrate-binding protein
MQARGAYPRVRLAALAVAVVLIVVGVIQSRPPSHVTIEVGPVGGSFYQIAQHYQKLFATRGIDLEIRPKDNSLEIMEDLVDPESGIDIGFETQDVSEYRHASVYTVGHIQLQPLFVFANAKLGRRIVLTDLRGRNIVMPPSNSATSAAAVRMFDLYDVTPENTTFANLPLADAANALRAGKYDAGVFMLAPENDVIRRLANDSGLRLVPFAEAKAIANHLPFLRPIVLPRGIYDIADGIPPTDVSMLAGTVDVVVRPGVHPYIIQTLLEAMSEEHRGATFLSGAGNYPTISGPELTVHPMAEDYYRSGTPWVYRNLPPWLASFVDHYLLVALAIFVVCEIYRSTHHVAEFSDGISALRNWWRRRRRRTDGAPADGNAGPEAH